MVEIRTNTEVTEISALDDCGVYFIETVDLSAGGNVEIFAEVTVNVSRYNIGKFNNFSNNLFVVKERAKFKFQFYDKYTLSVSLSKSVQFGHLYRKLHNRN